MGSKAGVMKVAAGRLGMTLEEYQARIEAGEKHCCGCKTWKPRAEFAKDRSRGDGLEAKCFSCRRVKERVNRKGRPSAFKGKRHTEETRQKLSEARRGRPSRMKGIPRPPEVRAKISVSYKPKARKGEQHHRWKGGITHEHVRIRASDEYAEWREEVFKRDSYACQRCGDSRGGNLRGHHILPFATHPHLRFVVDNGLTVCKPCHDIIHSDPNSTRNRAKARREQRKAA